jgi:hypothetical protein
MKEEDTQKILGQTWVHSHEEDTEEEMVFRPATFQFPPSRGRRSFELQPNGNLVEAGIAPTDGPEEMQGTWEIGEDDLVLRTDPSKTPRVMRIASVDEDRLIIEK